MRESRPSDDQAATTQPPKRERDFSDVVVSAGVLCVSAGAALIYLPAGVIVFGLALILIGARGQLAGAAAASTPPAPEAEA